MNTNKEKAEQIAKDRDVYSTVKTVASTGESSFDKVSYSSVKSRTIALNDDESLQVEKRRQLHGTSQYRVEHNRHGLVLAFDEDSSHRENRGVLTELKTFRPGRWLDALEKVAAEVNAQTEAERAAKEVAEEAERKKAEEIQFQPID
jgi:hypothetical protein